MSIVLEVSKNLLNMDDFWARVPSDSSSHEIPIIALLGRYTL